MFALCGRSGGGERRTCVYWAVSGESWDYLRASTSRFDDDMAPVSIDMRTGSEGRVDM